MFQTLESNMYLNAAGGIMGITEFILCPVCKNKTRLKIRKDTELKNFPLFCPKCKQETLISVKQLKTEIHKEPDAQTQSQ